MTSAAIYHQLWNGSMYTVADCTLICSLPTVQVTSADATLHTEHLSQAVAAGDNLGRIRLLRQPCTSPYADAKTYRYFSL